MEQKRKKKLSGVISVRLLIAVLIAFVASSGLTYVLLYRYCEALAHDMLIYCSQSLSFDLGTNTAATVAESGSVSLLDVYAEGGEEAVFEELEGSNYTYLVHEDGTIFVSGNEEFIGKNARDIPYVSDVIDMLFESMKNDPDMGNQYMMIPYPVETLDGKREIYYIVTVNTICPDAVLLDAFSEEDLKNCAIYAVNTVAMNRSVGMTGYSIAIPQDGNMITGKVDLLGKPFPYTELLDRFDSDTDDNIEVFGFPTILTDEVVDVETKVLYGKDEFWGEVCYYCLNEKFGIHMLCLYPVSEAMGQANETIEIIIRIEIIVFAVLFIVLNILIRRRVVKKLDAVNASLAKITDGDLNARVEVRETREFDTLSTDINTTVDRLKEYIAEAAARIDADLAVAKAIQTSALPSVFPPFPDRKEFELFASMTAAKEVGGDFYDFYMLNDNTLGFLIADVSGKSIPGAMFMMTAKTVIKSLAESGLPPAEVFTQANEKLCEGNDAEMFVTAWLGYLDLKTGIVHVANAGHNPPVLIRSGKAEYIVLKPGLMLAGMDGVRYKEQTVQLEKGDILYLFTDGVTEAMDTNEKLYGEDRLLKILSFGEKYPEPTAENGTVESVCKLVSDDLAAFTDGAEQSDDITMLCIRYLGGE